MKGIRAHYVPQFYLKNFGDRIYQYDKETYKINQTTPRKAASQRNFYVDMGDDEASALEGAMSQLEGNASAVISRIIRNGSIAGLSDADRVRLCEFVALQFARTPEFREWRGDMVQNLLDTVVGEMGITDWRIVEKDAKLAHLAAIPDSVDSIGPHLFQMRICLFKNDTSIPFWTSDNPVVRHNDLTGKLGAGSPGVQFYLPLSPKLILMLCDNTYIDLLGDMANDSVSRERWAWARSKIPETTYMEKENVIHVNRLQAGFSTRFVFSNKCRFPMMKAFRDRGGDYKMRHVFQVLGADEQGCQNSRAIICNGWECRDAPTTGGADALYHNLQNALWWYRKATQETNLSSAFMHLRMSLEMVTGLGWDEYIDGKEFDDGVRRLTGDQTLSLGKFRQIYNALSRNGHPDSHAGGAQMAKDVKEMRRIVAKAICGRLGELRSCG